MLVLRWHFTTNVKCVCLLFILCGALPLRYLDHHYREKIFPIPLFQLRSLALNITLAFTVSIGLRHLHELLITSGTSNEVDKSPSGFNDHSKEVTISTTGGNSSTVDVT